MTSPSASKTEEDALRLRSLEYFQEIVRCKSFTKASSRLFISQQGLSKALGDLEKKLGVTLLVRNGKEVLPTEEGSLLLSFANEVVAKYRKLEADFAKMNPNNSRHKSYSELSLAATPYISSGFLDRIEADSRKYGLDEVIVVEKSFPDILQEISKSELDFALVNFLDESLNLVMETERVSFMPLFSAKFLLLATDALIPARKDEIGINEALDIPLAFYNDPILNRFVEKTINALGAPKVILHSSNIDRINTLLNAGKAATFSDSFSYSTRKHSSHVKALKLVPSRSFFVGFLIGEGLNPESLAFDFIGKFTDMMKTHYGSYIDNNPVATPSHPYDNEFKNPIAWPAQAKPMKSHHSEIVVLSDEAKTKHT